MSVTAVDQRFRPFLTGARSRRDALHGGGALLAAMGASAFSPLPSVAAQATPVALLPGGGVLLVQSFSRGTLFPTQGDGDILPYTAILWDAATSGFFFTDWASGGAGVVPTESVLTALAARGDFTDALLVSPAAAASGSAATSEAVWALRLGYGGLGSDPGAVTYQGEPLAADEAAWLETAPTELPDGPWDLSGGYLIIAGLPGVEMGGADVRIAMG